MLDIFFGWMWDPFGWPIWLAEYFLMEVFLYSSCDLLRHSDYYAMNNAPFWSPKSP